MDEWKWSEGKMEKREMGEEGGWGEEDRWKGKKKKKKKVDQMDENDGAT